MIFVVVFKMSYKNRGLCQITFKKMQIKPPRNTLTLIIMKVIKYLICYFTSDNAKLN